MPFCVPWTDASDPDELPAELPAVVVADAWPPSAVDSWELNLCVLWEGEVVGIQGVATRDFPTLRFGETGSWLGRRFQGHGIGTAMRQAFCALLFDELGFEFVTSAAFTDNQASIQVSHKVGYRDNGIDWQHPARDARGTLQRMLLLPEDLVRGHPLTVTGAAAMRRFVGIEP
jgi:RimJ/RimL family protein N-acetyltransferase